jgi:outer membrane protein, multidrug efflux system
MFRTLSRAAIPFLSAASALACAGLVGCAVGPSYQAPKPAIAQVWHAPLPHQGSAQALGHWWAQFDDPALAQFIAWAEADSPTLLQAWASIEKARATLTSTRSGAMPSVSGSGSASRSKQQAGGTQSTLSTVQSLGLDASWEIDLFGRLRRNAEAADARIDARVADWHEARVSLAAEVGDTYVQYRACALLADAYARALSSAAATEAATASMVSAGLSASSDGALAKASFSSARSSALRQQAQCDLLMKSLVYLVGRDEPELLAAMAGSRAGIPRPDRLQVDSVPAEVLRQRPDLASLERELAAASAEIGAAQADLYPSLSLGGSISRSFIEGGSSYTAWSFGPQLSLPIFNGGQRRAAVDSAVASYRSALGSYRQGVRGAVKEVEEALVNLDSAAQRSQAARSARDEYRSYFKASEANWRAGTISLLSLEEARRSALSAEIDDISLQQNQVSYWIALYKAMGGGWTPGTPATQPAELAATDPRSIKNTPGATP